MRGFCVAIVLTLLLAGCEDERISYAKEAVRRGAKDPRSVEFRALRIGSDGKTVCGEFNARNSYGALAGFQPFFVSGSAFFPPQSRTRPEDTAMWILYEDRCNRSKP
jgi:hypothetical protein